MKKKDLLKAIGRINEKYLIEAEERADINAKNSISQNDDYKSERVGIMDEKKYIRKKLEPFIAVAAAFALVVGAFAYVGRKQDLSKEGSSGESTSSTDNSGSASNGKTEFSNTLILSIDEQNAAEAILNKDYENLTFDENFTVEFPEINSFETFTMTAKEGLSGQEVYDLFDAAVDKYFPGVFTEEEKKELYQATATNASGETISGTFEQHKEDFLGEDAAPFMLLTSEKGMLQMYGNGSTQTMTGTAAFNLDDPEQNSVGMYCAADNNKVIERIHVPQSGFESDMEYNLLDGNVKLTDAIAYTEHILTNDFDEGIANPDLIPDVYDAWVVDMGDGIYGYHFTMTHTYNNIRFDAQPMIKAMFTHPMNNDCKPYDNFPGYAFTIENGKLDSIMTVGYNLAYDISNVQTHDSMITAEDATDILSQSVSGSAGLVIERAEFMYTPYQETDGDSTSLIVDASWRFVGNNTNDGYNYLFYVNAVTGEFDYYRYS